MYDTADGFIPQECMKPVNDGIKRDKRTTSQPVKELMYIHHQNFMVFCEPTVKKAHGTAHFPDFLNLRFETETLNPRNQSSYSLVIGVSNSLQKA